MAYPTLEQYNEALHSPHLVLQDAELKHGRLKTSGLGSPLALCGGFALTYIVDVPGKRFALRCFHKSSRELEQRYKAISSRIRQLASPYFLPFEFITNGIRIQGSTYPIVKMAWAQGRTLAEFLEGEHHNVQALRRLRQALAQLAVFLEQNQIAHGDIQPENVMVSADGGTVQLIDYDGMFVEGFRGRFATELGQINFQHPRRTDKDFNERLDRFSFLTLDVALQALIASPSLWGVSRSEPSAVVFRRNDFLDPGSSIIFSEVLKLPGVANHAKNLARVVVGDFQSVPALSDFLQDKGVVGGAITFKQKGTPSTVGYQGAYPVCDATKYAQVLTQVGSRIELIGQIHSVRPGFGANKKPYVFVNFSDWLGQAVKLSIWSDGMKAIGSNLPDESWVGRWLSVTGLVDPPYKGKAKAGSYTHLSLTITATGQIQQLPEQEAKFRLRGLGHASAVHPVPSRNADVLSNMAKGRPTTVTPSLSPPVNAVPPKSSNQQLLEKMRAKSPQIVRQKASAPQVPTQWQNAPASRPVSAPKRPSGADWLGWLFIVIVGLGLLRSCIK